MHNARRFNRVNDAASVKECAMLFTTAASKGSCWCMLKKRSTPHTHRQITVLVRPVPPHAHIVVSHGGVHSACVHNSATRAMSQFTVRYYQLEEPMGWFTLPLSSTTATTIGPLSPFVCFNCSMCVYVWLLQKRFPISQWWSWLWRRRYNHAYTNKYTHIDCLFVCSIYITEREREREKYWIYIYICIYAYVCVRTMYSLI